MPAPDVLLVQDEGGGVGKWDDNASLSARLTYAFIYRAHALEICSIPSMFCSVSDLQGIIFLQEKYFAEEILNKIRLMKHENQSSCNRYSNANSVCRVAIYKFIRSRPRYLEA